MGQAPKPLEAQSLHWRVQTVSSCINGSKQQSDRTREGFPSAQVNTLATEAASALLAFLSFEGCVGDSRKHRLGLQHTG